MKIGINGYEAVVPRFGFDENSIPRRVGSSEVCFQLIKELAIIDKKNEYTIYLPIAPTSDMPKENDNWHYKIIPSVKLWTVFGLNKSLLRDNLDVFFSPSHYGPIIAKFPQVISILDLSYKYFPEAFKKNDLYKLALWGRYSVSRAKKIITISDSSKNDIIKEYKVSEDKVHVIPLGIKDIKDSNMTKDELVSKYSINNPYILFVGTLQPRKNLVRLIEAFKIISESNKKLDLVIVGRRGWLYDEILEAPKTFNVEENVKFLETVDDSDLPALYKNAETFVLPSLYEGFGLPVLEAMKYGCPVVASNSSSLPEAGGKAALYFDPYNVDDIAKAILKVVDDPKKQASMKKEGLVQVAKFSWEKAARMTLETLTEAALK